MESSSFTVHENEQIHPRDTEKRIKKRIDNKK